MSDSEDLAELYGRTREAADAFRAKAAEIHELTKRLENLTEDIPAWYAGTRARVEARTALEQAEGLRRVLEEVGERLGEWGGPERMVGARFSLITWWKFLFALEAGYEYLHDPLRAHKPLRRMLPLQLLATTLTVE